MTNNSIKHKQKKIKLKKKATKPYLKKYNYRNTILKTAGIIGSIGLLGVGAKKIFDHNKYEQQIQLNRSKKEDLERIKKQELERIKKQELERLKKEDEQKEIRKAITQLLKEFRKAKIHIEGEDIYGACKTYNRFLKQIDLGCKYSFNKSDCRDRYFLKYNIDLKVIKLALSKINC